MKKQMLTYPIFILSLISIIVFIGCQQEDSFEESKVKEVYLSLPPNVNFDKLTENDLEIISQAFSRLDLRENEDGLFEIFQNSGKEMNVSNEIFNYFQLTAESSNERILSDISFSRNRVQTRTEAGNAKTDCVARSIATATGQNYDKINAWIVEKYGTNGVSPGDFHEVMSHFNKSGDTVKLSDFENMEIRSGHNDRYKYVVVINNSHAVNLVGKSGSNIIYNDKQNNVGGFCSASDITHVYEVR